VAWFDPAARGCVSSIVYAVFRRDRKWLASGESHLQVVEEKVSERHHPVDLQVVSFYHGRGLLAHQFRPSLATQVGRTYLQIGKAIYSLKK